MLPCPVILALQPRPRTGRLLLALRHEGRPSPFLSPTRNPPHGPPAPQPTTRPGPRVRLPPGPLSVPTHLCHIQSQLPSPAKLSHLCRIQSHRPFSPAASFRLFSPLATRHSPLLPT